MGNVWDKIMSFAGLGTVDDDDQDYIEVEEELEEEPVEYQPPVRARKRENKVVNIHQNASMRLIVAKPTRFEDAREMIDHLKSRKPLVINLEDVDLKVARRIIDFVSGSVYAVEGHIEKVSDVIFVISPSNIDISGNVQQVFSTVETQGTGFPWEV